VSEHRLQPGSSAFCKSLHSRIGPAASMAFSGENSLVYPASGLGVVHNFETNSQKFFFGHSREVTCLALNKPKQMVATGQKAGVTGTPYFCFGDDECGSSVASRYIAMGQLQRRRRTSPSMHFTDSSRSGGCRTPLWFPP